MVKETNISINENRLWDSLMEMAKIGPGIAGGNNRQTVTFEDGEARKLLQKWASESGMSMKVDELGSMFFKRDGTDKNALPVVIGSHLDTQPTGGKYDGVLGVLAGLEVVRTLNDLNIKTKRPILVVNWTNEEGSRFPPAMMASAGYAGIYDTKTLLAATEYEGKAVVGKVNVDLHGGIAAQFGVRNIPTIVFLKNGEVVDKVVGAVPKEQLAEKLDANI